MCFVSGTVRRVARPRGEIGDMMIFCVILTSYGLMEYGGRKLTEEQKRYFGTNLSYRKSYFTTEGITSSAYFVQM